MQLIITKLQYVLPLLLLSLGLLAVIFLTKLAFRYFIKRVTNDAMSKLLTDDYDQNIADLARISKLKSECNLLIRKTGGFN